MKAKLYRVILPVPEIDAAASFYSELLGAAGERVSPGRHYFDLGGTILALYDPPADGDSAEDGWRHHSKQILYVATDELAPVRERAVRLGATDTTPIAEMPWGERLFYTRDPFGTPLAFVDGETVFLGHPRRDPAGR